MRRQWGTERISGAAPVMHAMPSRSAMSGARFALFLTVAAWLAYFAEQVRRYVDHPYGAARQRSRQSSTCCSSRC